jgi:glyoxylase-like metal-dependent hydrolase (beta-lactamase superfamily II)
MHEILPGIYAWRWPSPRFGYDFNGHWMQGLCIDPVEMDDATLEELAERGVYEILITNRNHFRAAERVRQRTSAKIAVHPADAEFVRSKGVTVEGALADGQMVGPLRVIAVPGKSPGEVAFHWPERRVLVVGDACVGTPPGQLALLHAAVIDDPALLRESLRGLLDVDFDTMLVGDGAAIIGGAKERLRELVERA